MKWAVLSFATCGASLREKINIKNSSSEREASRPGGPINCRGVPVREREREREEKRAAKG